MNKTFHNSYFRALAPRLDRARWLHGRTVMTSAAASKQTGTAALPNGTHYLIELLLSDKLGPAEACDTLMVWHISR